MSSKDGGNNKPEIPKEVLNEEPAYKRTLGRRLQRKWGKLMVKCPEAKAQWLACVPYILL